MDPDTKQAIELCLRGVLAEQLEPAIDRALERRDLLLGLPTTPEKAEEFRKAFEFSTWLRQAYLGAALAVGQSIIGAAFVGLLLLAAWAFKLDHLK